MNDLAIKNIRRVPPTPRRVSAPEERTASSPEPVLPAACVNCIHWGGDHLSNNAPCIGEVSRKGWRTERTFHCPDFSLSPDAKPRCSMCGGLRDAGDGMGYRGSHARFAYPTLCVHCCCDKSDSMSGRFNSRSSL